MVDRARPQRSVARRAVDLALACHPGPTVAVTVFAVAMAAGADAPAATTALVGAAVLAGQLSVGWSNDWIDADRDAAVGRTDKPVGDGRLAVVDGAHGGARRARGRASCCRWRSAGAPGSCTWRPSPRRGPTTSGSRAPSWSWAPYAFSFGFLPLAIALALPGSPVAAWWAMVGGRAARHRRARRERHPGPAGRPRHRRPRAAAPGRRHGHEHRLGASALVAATVLVVLAPAGPAVDPRRGRGARRRRRPDDPRARRSRSAAAAAGCRSRAIAVAAVDVVLLVRRTGSCLTRTLDFERARRGRLHRDTPIVEGAPRARRCPPHAFRLGRARHGAASGAGRHGRAPPRRPGSPGCRSWTTTSR